VLERFNDGARRVVALGQEESRLLKHNHIGTEHLLLGLIRQRDAVVASVLDSLGIEYAAAREQVVTVVGIGSGPSGYIPFTPRAKKALELSFRESQRLGRDIVQPAHILIGLCRLGESVGVQVLSSRGADTETVRTQVLQALAVPDVRGRVWRRWLGPRSRRASG
jgi:ATP-dependent Clp protease ATP-binding subunit ClpC